MSTLRAQCAKQGVAPPTVGEVLRALPLAVNDARFPSVDVDALMRVIDAEVPALVGEV